MRARWRETCGRLDRVSLNQASGGLENQVRVRDGIAGANQADRLGHTFLEITMGFERERNSGEPRRKGLLLLGAGAVTKFNRRENAPDHEVWGERIEHLQN